MHPILLEIGNWPVYSYGVLLAAAYLSGLQLAVVRARRIGLDGARVMEVTNQSTGYCPEPECWSAVAATLDRLCIEHPPAFTVAFIFRCCASCDTINIVKEGVFECAVCEAELSRVWDVRLAMRAG